MSTRSSCLFVLLLPLTLLFVNVGVSKGAVSKISGDVYHAQDIPENGYQAAFANEGVGPRYRMPEAALGAPDAKAASSGFVSLGNSETPSVLETDPRNCEGYIILEWDTFSIANGDGPDIQIFESGSNSGGGTPEYVNVFISQDDKTWYYVGQTDEGDSFDIGVVTETPDDAVYRYVALCDVADGRTTIWPYAGPDIDAVKALHTTTDEPVLVAESSGEENEINGEPQPDGETWQVEVGDVLTGNDNGEIELQAKCKEAIERQAKLLSAAVEANAAPHIIQRELIALKYVLFCAKSGDKVVEAAAMEFELEGGSVKVQVAEDELEMAIRTDFATAATQGRAHFDVVHDLQMKETTIKAWGGPVSVTPTNGALPPFELEQGGTVVVTADSVSEPVFEVFGYLPLVRGN